MQVAKLWVTASGTVAGACPVTQQYLSEGTSNRESWAVLVFVSKSRRSPPYPGSVLASPFQEDIATKAKCVAYCPCLGCRPPEFSSTALGSWDVSRGLHLQRAVGEHNVARDLVLAIQSGSTPEATCMDPL